MLRVVFLLSRKSHFCEVLLFILFMHFCLFSFIQETHILWVKSDLGTKDQWRKMLKGYHKDEAWWWHKRFDHLNFGALKTLGDEKMVKGCLTSTILINCPKHARSSFPTEVESRAKVTFQPMHIDVCGPIDLFYLVKKNIFSLYWWFY